MRLVLPCMSRFARTIFAPKACAIAWWPRQMPRIGIFPANAFIASSVTPALSGFPGPGEMISASGFFAAIPATSILSFLTTSISALSDLIICTRL